MKIVRIGIIIVTWWFRRGFAFIIIIRRFVAFFVFAWLIGSWVFWGVDNIFIFR